MDMASGNIGPEAKFSLKLEGGKVRAEIGYDGAGADAGMFVMVDAEYFIDQLAAMIPGQIDDMVLGMLKAAMKAQG